MPRSFYDRPADAVAPELLGQILVRRRHGSACAGRIVEVEAYLGPHDAAAHSARGRTARTEVMFGEPGHAYVYLIYGLHHCMNVVTGPGHAASAVLLRALEPLEGIERPTRGPGLLTRALEIDRRQNGVDLLGEELFIVAAPAVAPRAVVRRPRVGVDYAGSWARRLLRYYERGNPHISRP